MPGEHTRVPHRSGAPIVSKHETRQAGARQRLLDAAYDLFSRHGVAQVGVDTIIAEAGCAKASLYYNFGSKDGLALAFLARRDAQWTRGWLQQEVTRRAVAPADRLLAVFDVLDDWFRRDDFEGCSFVKVLLETASGRPVREASAGYLAGIRAILRGWAEAAGLAEPDRFARTWQMLMMGAAVAAGEGHRDAALDAKRAAALLLAGWPRATDATAAPAA
jgi:AcrR family transcriptional regulator